MLDCLGGGTPTNHRVILVSEEKVVQSMEVTIQSFHSVRSDG